MIGDLLDVAGISVRPALYCIGTRCVSGFRIRRQMAVEVGFGWQGLL